MVEDNKKSTNVLNEEKLTRKEILGFIIGISILVMFVGLVLVKVFNVGKAAEGDKIYTHVTAELEKTEYEASLGTEVKPKVQNVKLGDEDLTEGTDYKLIYERNVEPGQGQVLIVPSGSRKFAVKTLKFKLKGLEIEFNAKGHGVAPATQLLLAGEKVKKPTDPKEEGYTFLGWYKEDTCTNEWNFETEVTEDMTLYAKWEINKYTVTFDMQGHGTALANQTIEYKAKIQKTNPKDEGDYVFLGWYKEETCTNEWNFETETMPASDVILYAKWRLGYRLNGVNAEGKALLIEDIQKTESQAVTYTYGGKTYKAYNGYIEKTGYADCSDARGFVQMLNRINYDGCKSWKLFFTNGEAEAWHKATFNTEEGVETRFDLISEVWTTYTASPPDSQGYYWSFSGPSFYHSNWNSSVKYRGFVVVCPL